MQEKHLSDIKMVSFYYIYYKVLFLFPYTTYFSYNGLRGKLEVIAYKAHAVKFQL